jgi:hypothetical protein
MLLSRERAMLLSRERAMLLSRERAMLLSRERGTTRSRSLLDLARALLAVGELGLVNRGCDTGSGGAEAGKLTWAPLELDDGWVGCVSFGAGGQRACNRSGPPGERDCVDDDPAAIRYRGDVGGGTSAPLNRRTTGAIMGSLLVHTHTRAPRRS